MRIDLQVVFDPGLTHKPVQMSLTHVWTKIVRKAVEINILKMILIGMQKCLFFLFLCDSGG